MGGAWNCHAPGPPLFLLAFLAGCLYLPPGTPTGFEWEDTDLDGIPDDYEERIASDCWVLNYTCTELQVEPPEVGVRDFVIIEHSQTGHTSRLSEDSWDTLEGQLSRGSIRFQRADLGQRDDLDPEDQFEEGTEFFDGFAWYITLRHEPEHDEYLGYQQGVWIGLNDEGTSDSQTSTLLHEVFHAILGPLNGAHSTCDDEDAGGETHSDDENSVLYVDGDCEPADPPQAWAWTDREMEELLNEPIDAFWHHNHACWWRQGLIEGTPCDS